MEIDKSKSLTTKAFKDFLSATIEGSRQDTGPVKYVMYVRKSTDETGNQVRSIDDQIAECKEYAKRIGINYLEIILEKKSAKESGKRPEFRKMLNAIEQGIYNGILCWHPDRLSRNMKEAGEIIDLIDKNIIKDLKCVSFTFNNDPAGKLLLGITFAMSKEYSDKLSENVKRGNKHSLEEGNYINKAKDGYYKDSEGKLRPDGEYFNLVRKIVDLRFQEETLEFIADYVEKNKEVARGKSISKRKWKQYRKQEVSEVLSDSIYTGVFIYGKKVVNFNDIYDFQPVITPDEYLTLNRGLKTGKFKRLTTYFKNEGVKANLMRGRVICGECYRPMISGITHKIKQNKNYFYYRCETEGCARRNRSERAKVILDYACEYIQNNFKYTKETWEHYKKETMKVYKDNVSALSSKLQDFELQKVKLSKKVESIRNKLYDTDNPLSPSMQKDVEGDYQQALDQLQELEVQIQTLKHSKEQKLHLLGESEFLELMQKLPDFLKQNQSMEVLDQVMKKIFLNFVVLRKKVISVRLLSPFDALFGTDVPAGAQERT